MRGLNPTESDEPELLISPASTQGSGTPPLVNRKARGAMIHRKALGYWATRCTGRRSAQPGGGW